jgi:hypothetical protein
MRLSRRDLLKLGGLSALSWALPSSARAQESASRPGPSPDGLATSLIVLWLDGGPSQLETFDPKPGSKIGGPTQAIATKQKGVQFARGYEALADRADRLAILRSVVSQEGEHTRGRYLLRTGFPLLPTVTRPAIGAVVAHELPRDELEIPKHVSFLHEAPPRGGFLGAELNAFAVGDPQGPLPDLVSPVGRERYGERLKGLDLVEGAFAKGREKRVGWAQHRSLAGRSTAMMDSEQVKAFDFREESADTISSYGDTPFGRSCLVARRLVETGVPAIEVSLGGWDTHVDNFELHAKLAPTLDRAFAALLDDLQARDLAQRTLVVCCGEFGRTPRVNGLGGRDHWTRGFSVLLSGGGIREGITLGETDPSGEGGPTDPIRVPDLFATLYARLGIDGSQWFDSDQGRPVQLCKGTAISGLIG